ncbi:MAG: hypothetical protein R6X17_07860 [Candidatus Competibacteraceae bacterium]
MYTILETVTATMGLSLAELPAFFVAGTFGVFIDVPPALRSGRRWPCARTTGPGSLGYR